MSTSKGNNSSKGIVYMRKNPPQQNQINQNQQNSNQLLQNENQDQGERISSMYFNQEEKGQKMIQSREEYFFNNNNQNPQSQNDQFSAERQGNIYKSSNGSNLINNQSQIQIKTKQKLSQTSIPFNNNQNHQQIQNLQTDQIKSQGEVCQNENLEQKNEKIEEQNMQIQISQASSQNPKFSQPFLGIILLNANETSQEALKNVYFIVINQKEVKIQDHYEFTVSSQEDELQDMQDHFQVISQKIDYYFTKAEEGFIMSYASKQVKTLLKQFKLLFLEHEINKEAIFIDQIIPEKYTKTQNSIQLNQLMEDLEMKQDSTLQEKTKILSYFNNQFSTNLIMCILKIVSQGFFITQALSSGWRERNKYQTKINNFIKQISQPSKAHDEIKDNAKNQQNKNQQIEQVSKQNSMNNLNQLEQKSDLASSQNLLANDPQISNQEGSSGLYLLNNQDTQKQAIINNNDNNNNNNIADQGVIQNSNIQHPASSEKEFSNFNQKSNLELGRLTPQKNQEQQNKQITDLSIFQNDSNLLNKKSDFQIQQNQQIQNNQQKQQINQNKITRATEKQNNSTHSQTQINEESRILATPISQGRAVSQSIQLRSEIQHDLNLLKSNMESNQNKLNSSFLNNLNNRDNSNPYRANQMTSQKEPALENEDFDIILEIKKEINETQQLSDSVTNLKNRLIQQVSHQQQFLSNFVDKQTNAISNLRQKQGVLFEFIVNLNQDTENLIQQQQQQLNSFLEDFNKQNSIQQELIMNEIQTQDNKFNSHLQSLENLANRVQYSQEVKQSEIQQQQQAMQEASRLLLDCSQALLYRNPLSISQIRESIYQQSFLNNSVSQINEQTTSQVFNIPSYNNQGCNYNQSKKKQSTKYCNSDNDNEQTDIEKIHSFNDKNERSQKDSLSSSFQSQKKQLQNIQESNFQQKNIQNNLEQNRIQQNVNQHEQLNKVCDQNQKNQNPNSSREHDEKHVEYLNLSAKTQIQQQQTTSQTIQNNQKQEVSNSTNTLNTQEPQQLEVKDISKTSVQQNKLTNQQQQTNNQQIQDKINLTSDQINKINEINSYIQNMNTPNSDIIANNNNNQLKNNDKLPVQYQTNNLANQQDQTQVISRNSLDQQNKNQILYEKKESEQQQKQQPNIENKFTNSIQQNQKSKLQNNCQKAQQNQQFQQREIEQQQKPKSDNEKETKISLDSSKNLFINTKNNTDLNQSLIQSSDISVQINTVMTKPSTSEISISNIKSTENLAEENISSAKRRKIMLLKQKINQNIEPFLPNEEILKDIQNQKEKTQFIGSNVNIETQNQGDSTESSGYEQKDKLDINKTERQCINLNQDVVENRNSVSPSLKNKNILIQPENKSLIEEIQNNQNSNQIYQNKNLSQFIEEQQKKRKESIKDLQESFQSSNNSSQIIKSDNLILQSELFEQPKKSIFEGNSFMLAIYQQTLEAEKRADQSKNNSKQSLAYSEPKKAAQVKEIKQQFDKIENSQKKIRKQQSQTDHEEYKKSFASSKEDETITQYQLMKNFTEENMSLNDESLVKNQFIQNDTKLLRQNLKDKKQEAENQYEKFEDNSNTSRKELKEDDDQNEEFEEEEEQYKVSSELKDDESKSKHNDEGEDNYSGIKEAQKEQQVNSPHDKVQKQFLKPPSSTQPLQSSSSKLQLPTQYASSSLMSQKNLGSQLQRDGQPAIQLTGFEKSTLFVYNQIQEKQKQINCSSSQYTLQKTYNGGQNTFSNYSKHNNNNSNRNKSTERSFSSNKNQIPNGITNTSNQSQHHSHVRHNNYKENQGYNNNKNSKQYMRSQSSQEHYWRAPQVEYIDKRQLTSQFNLQRKMSNNFNSSSQVFDSQSSQAVAQQAQKAQTNSYPYSNNRIDEEEKLNSSIISRQTEVEYNNIYDLIKPRNRMSPKELSQALKKNTEEVQQRLNKWKDQEELQYQFNTQNIQSTNDQIPSEAKKKKLTKSTVQMLIVLNFQLNQYKTEIIEISTVIVNTDRYQTIDEFSSFVKPIDTRISCEKYNISQNILKIIKISQPFEVVFAKLCNFFKPYLDNYRCCILYDQQQDSEILYNEFINKKIIPCPTVLEIFYTCIFLTDIYPLSLNTKNMPVKNYHQAMTLLELKKHFTKKNNKPIEIKNFEKVVTTLLAKGVIICSKDVKCAFSLDQRERKVQQFITQCMESFEQSQYFLILEFQHGKYDAYNQIENSAVNIQILQKTTGFSFIHIHGVYGFSYDFYRNDISAFHFFFQSYLNALKVNQNHLTLFVLEEDNILANQVIELMFPVKKKPQKLVLFKEVQAQIMYNLEHILQKNAFSFNFEQLFSTLCGQSQHNNQNLFQM